MSQLRASLVISLAAAAAATGCADQGGSQIIVLHSVVPDEGCTLEAAEGGDFRSAGLVDGQGVLDGGSAVYGYLAAPLIQNVSDSSDGELTAERTVILHGARVDLTVGTRADGSDVLDAATIADLDALDALHFTVLFSGSVAPDGGLTALSFEVIPVVTVRAIAERLTDAEDRVLVQASFTVFGETTAGSEVEADPFLFPVTVCTGCLFQNVGSCVGLPDGEYAVGNTCNLYQDSVTQCCESTSGSFICPATPQDPPT